MTQISKGDTFADGQQVTGARLNQLIDSATLLAGAITDQSNITANTVASGDSILLYDLSDTALREANVSDVLGSNLPITTSAITAGANSDLLITTNDGVIVTGKAYTSGDGLTVTVTSTAHILTVGQVILITAAGTGYNGTFQVATIATNSFTYVMTTAATAGSSTLSYTKKGLVKNTGNKSVAGNLYVDGSTAVAGSEYVAGSLTVAGSTTLAGALTSSGTANFTGDLQVNGTVGYVLTDVVEETMTPWDAILPQNYSSIWTSSAFVKPSNEIWVFEVDFHFSGISGYGFSYGFRYSTETNFSGIYKVAQFHATIGNNGGQVYHQTKRWVEGIGTTLASQTLKVDTSPFNGSQQTMFRTSYSLVSFAGYGTTTVAPSKFRIYKYKTA